MIEVIMLHIYYSLAYSQYHKSAHEWITARSSKEIHTACRSSWKVQEFLWKELTNFLTRAVEVKELPSVST